MITKSKPEFTYKVLNEEICIHLKGEYNIQTVPNIWKEIDLILNEQIYKKILLECKEITNSQIAGISLLFHIKEYAKENKKDFRIENLDKKFSELLDMFSLDKKHSPLVKFQDNWYTPEQVGSKTIEIVEDIKQIIEFMGATIYMLYLALKNPFKIKWKEVISISEKAGVNALPIILLIGFLFGLIMSFQSAIPMQKFGAEIYVANLVALSLFRELGPLMTSVILAGRTASSFSAEIGTMKVSEEVDAIITMGLSPLEFLVIPRIISAILVTPILTIFFNLAGLVGSLVVILSFKYPFITYYNQVISSVKNLDLIGGLYKATVFGIVIAGIGCFHGLNTKTGASAVGESTTKSVVNGIISIALLDGLFAVLFYYLGI